MLAGSNGASQYLPVRCGISGVQNTAHGLVLCSCQLCQQLDSDPLTPNMFIRHAGKHAC